MRRHGGLNQYHCLCKILGFLGCMVIFSTFRPGHFLLYEGEENLPRLWKNLQKEQEQGLHTVRIKYRLRTPLP